MDLKIRLYLRFMVLSLNNYKLNFKFIMKKFVLTTIVAVAAVGSGAYGYFNHSGSTVQTPLEMSNIEALSSYEIIVGWDKNCIYGGDGCCPNAHQWMPEHLPC